LTTYVCEKRSLKVRVGVALSLVPMEMSLEDILRVATPIRSLPPMDCLRVFIGAGLPISGMELSRDFLRVERGPGRSLKLSCHFGWRFFLEAGADATDRASLADFESLEWDRSRSGRLLCWEKELEVAGKELMLMPDDVAAAVADLRFCCLFPLAMAVDKEYSLGLLDGSLG